MDRIMQVYCRLLYLEPARGTGARGVGYGDASGGGVIVAL